MPISATKQRFAAAAQQFRDDLSASQQPQATQEQPQQVTAPAAAPAPSAPAQMAPEPATGETQFASVSDVAATLPPQYYQPQVQNSAELQQIQSENDQLRRELAAMRHAQQEQVNAAAQARAQLDQLHEEQEIQRFDAYARQQWNDAQNRMYAAVIKAHPDLQQMQSHPAYAQMMASPAAPGSRITIGQMVAGELQQGNTAYVINVLNDIKRRITAPTGSGALANVASVSSSTPSAGGAGGVDKKGDILSYDDMAELRYQLQTRQITRDQFRERMAKHREASKAS